MNNANDKHGKKTPIEALAEFLTEVWKLLRADRKAPSISYAGELNSTNDFNAAQAMYLVDDDLILVCDSFANANWKLYGRVVKQAVHELFHAFQVQVIGRELNYELYNFEDGSINAEYYDDKNEIEAHAFDEWFEQYWLKITTRNQHTPAIPDCDLLPKYRFEKEYRKFESRYSGSMLKNAKVWDLLTIELLRSLRLIKI